MAPAPNVRERARLVVLATHPVQYFAPLYRCLAERGALHIKVVYLSDAGAVAYHDAGFGRTVAWDIPLLSGYEACVLQAGANIESRSFWTRHDRGLVDRLARERPDWLLVYGYASRMNWVAARWARRSGTKVLYCSDSNVRDARAGRLVRTKQIVLRYYFGLIDAFLATSEANAEYLLRFGADLRRVHRAPYAIDVSRFRRPPQSPIGSPRRYDFVWAGKLIETKRAGDFVRALDVVGRRCACRIRALVIGAGPCRAAVEAAVSRLPGNCSVDFAGFLNQTEMPAALQSADSLVFTSEQEAYGLIATEAAAAGLALIVAENIGCVGDSVLARPGVNAVTFRCGDLSQLAGAMESMLSRPDLRTKMQAASQAIAATHDVTCAAEVVERIVRTTHHRA